MSAQSIDEIRGPGVVQVHHSDELGWQDHRTSNRDSYVLRLRQANDRAREQGRRKPYLSAIIDGHKWEL